MNVTADDIAAMKRDGSFKEFLELMSRPTAPAPAPVPVQVDRDPGHRPGAWPAGTRPPTPPAPQDSADWQQAVHNYRAWMAAGQPDGPIFCECGACLAGPGAQRRAAA